MKQEFFWHVTVRCAQCGEAAGVDQPGSLPQNWIGVIVNERLPALARNPAEVVREQAKYTTRPYPVCSASCGAKLLIAQALATVRTKTEKVTLIAQLKEVVDGSSGVQSRPN